MTTSAPVRLALRHPAAFDADRARQLPIEERAWYVTVPGETPSKAGPGWLPLETAVDVPHGADLVEIRTGPDRGPWSVRAKVLRRGDRWFAGVGGGRLLVEVGSAAAPAPVPAPGTVTMTGAAETVSEIALERVTGDAAALSAIPGMALPPVVRVLGGRVNSTGTENYSVSHKAHEELPRTIDALEEVRSIVRAEERFDLRVDRTRLALDETGALIVDGAPVRLEEAGLRGLVGLYSDTLPSATALLATLPPPERAELFNRQLRRSELRGTIRLRTRLVEGIRQAFAVVGEGYADRDADALATDMIDALRRFPGGDAARGEVVYDPANARLRATALWHADHVVDLACGDIFKAGLGLESSDNGGGSIKVWFEVLRNLCYNLIILGKGTAPLARVQHRGNARVNAERLRRAMAEGLRHSERFVARWVKARGVDAATALAELRGGRKVTDATGAEVDLRDLFARAAQGAGRVPADEQVARVAYEQILDLDHLDLPARRDATVELLLSGWRHERGTDLAAIINGVTRVHEAAIPVETRTRFEVAAGMLLPA